MNENAHKENFKLFTSYNTDMQDELFFFVRKIYEGIFMKSLCTN